MKVLSIGNSFSQDAHKWIHQLAKMNDLDMKMLNLYIGGCSLEQHWSNIQTNAEAYDFEPNGILTNWKISIESALELTDWDIVTVQQVSSKSGMPETYEPYLSGLVALIRKLQPKAEIWFHQTWAYEIDSTHSGFANYDNDQRKMFDALVKASEAAAASIPAKIIPAGTLIQKLRETVPEFDYAKGGMTLNRDGYHLTRDYGRFAAAALWIRTLTGIEVIAETFEDFDPILLQKILVVVNAQEV